MTNKKFCTGTLVVVISIYVFFIAACASIKPNSSTIQPMSNEAISKYNIASNQNGFRNFQYYVSRDIVLTYNSSETQSAAVGQINVNRDIIQILPSTPGVALEVRQDENGNTMLGVAFEASNDNLLWFVQNPSKTGTYFYLVYTNEAAKEIDYGGNSYAVSYENAGGVEATISRLNPFGKVKQGDYDTMEPILLYEEVINQSEQRRNVEGRTL